ncbi:MAG TPA: FAD-dependent oxidoreductase [Flavobacterium sp.]|jgi:hypothetical protein
MANKPDVIIIGGGLAGLTAGIHLSRHGINVTIIEKNEFPKHKVCGEYVSNEVLPYLNSLGIDISSLHPANITRTAISTISGKKIEGTLPLGGFGISRYALDFLLFQTAKKYRCDIRQETVSDVVFSNDNFHVKTSEGNAYQSTIAIGAYGKRSHIDLKLQRDFASKKSPWLAVKAHYKGNFPDGLVALHNFRGGYCGVSKVENNMINICWLGGYKEFKKFRDIGEYQKQIITANPHLKVIFENSEMLFNAPLAISQICFDKKNPVENHVLMTGDSAGLIHPLCGNGMAMAIHSAKIISELTLDFFHGKISRSTLEENYAQQWKIHFGKRMVTGRMLAALLQKETLSRIMMRLLVTFPSLLQPIIKMTHGKPIAAGA